MWTWLRLVDLSISGEASSWYLWLSIDLVLVVRYLSLSSSCLRAGESAWSLFLDPLIAHWLHLWVFLLFLTQLKQILWLQLAVSRLWVILSHVKHLAYLILVGCYAVGLWENICRGKIEGKWVCDDEFARVCLLFIVIYLFVICFIVLSVCSVYS